jgi:uncharacterized protein
LEKLGFDDIDPAEVGQMDSVDHIDDLSRIGRRLAQEVRLEHFGHFVNS